MRLLAFAIYALLLLAGTAFIVLGRDSESELIAARTLPKNHLLQPGDVVLRADGRYVTRELSAGSAVLPTDLASSPEIPRVEGSAPISVKVDHSAIANGTIHAGKAVMVCPAAVMVKVDAVICGAEAATCIAITHVPVDKSNEMGDKGDLSLQVGQACK